MGYFRSKKILNDMIWANGGIAIMYDYLNKKGNLNKLEENIESLMLNTDHPFNDIALMEFGIKRLSKKLKKELIKHGKFRRHHINSDYTNWTKWHIKNNYIKYNKSHFV